MKFGHRFKDICAKFDCDLFIDLTVNDEFYVWEKFGKMIITRARIFKYKKYFCG